MYLVPATLVLSGLHVTVKTIEKDQDTAPGTIISLNPPISIASIQPIISLNLPVSIAIINATPIIKPYYHLVTPLSSISSTILCYNTLCYNRSHLSLPIINYPFLIHLGLALSIFMFKQVPYELVCLRSLILYYVVPKKQY